MTTSKASESPAAFRLKKLHDLKCPTRDGTELSTDVYMPSDAGAWPALLLRTPYDNISELSMQRFRPVEWARRGYVFVTQDTRGRYDSSGQWYPFINEVEDGHDAVEWVAKQPWCNGKVGTLGGSYTGLTQLQAAQAGSSHLLAMAPRVAYSDTYHNWVYTGGAFQLAFGLTWSILMSARTAQPQYLWLPEEVHLSTLNWHLPLITTDEAAGRTIRHWKDWVSHPSYDQYWRDLSPIEEHYQDVEAPAYHMGGWFDVFLQGTLNNFMGMSTHAKTEGARRGQRLLIGPWIHQLGQVGTPGKTGDIDFGPNSIIDLSAEEGRWFDYWLKDTGNGIMDEPRVKVFVMGANRWRLADDWPLPETQYTPYYFHSQGDANSLFGDGFLDTDPPEQETADQFNYDPAHPVMTIGGSTCCVEDSTPVSMGPRDQRPNEYRTDVLVYTTAPLANDVEVTGPVKVFLHASSSAKDTDFVAKLVDVFPNEYAMNVAEGILRARYRDSWESPTLLDPDQVYMFEIDLWSTSNCFQKGHRIRVEITSSNFPHYDRNPNTGHPFGQDAELQTASQTVFHDRERPSHILLPVIP